MCWFGINRKKIAQEDIPIFKLVCKDKCGAIFSAQRYFVYELDTEYSTELTRRVSPYSGNYAFITQGFHSYMPYVKLKRCHITLYVTTCRGYELVRFNLYLRKMVILQCVIPKGATYYVNASGEVVSNSIKTVKLVPLGDVLSLGALAPYFQ